MISITSFNRIQAEQSLIESGCRDELAKRTDDSLSFTRVTDPELLAALRESGAPADIIYYEIVSRSDVERLRQLRGGDRSALLMLLAASGLSPMLYLKPGISPDMLLLRPFSREDFDSVNGELFDSYFAALESAGESDSFVLSDREGKTVFPFSGISYFEARNKKVILHAGIEEYDFYDSIENLLQTLPAYFIRCHRAFLINSRRIKKLNLAESLVEMDLGAAVPISRTYRQSVKAIFQERR